MPICVKNLLKCDAGGSHDTDDEQRMRSLSVDIKTEETDITLKIEEDDVIIKTEDEDITIKEEPIDW